MGRTESKAALRPFGTAAGPHAGTQRIRPNVHGCSGGRGGCHYLIQLHLLCSQYSLGRVPLQLILFRLMPCKELLQKASRFYSTRS